MRKGKFLKAATILLIIAVSFAVFVAYPQYHFKHTIRAEGKSYAISSWNGDYMLLARLVAAEASGEPYPGQVGVAAVILNRTKHPKFPPTVAGVIFQPGAFESVSNGHIWASYPTRQNFRAAREALNGWDPTYGSLYFWNPYKRVSPWIWSRRIIIRIGKHVFGR